MGSTWIDQRIIPGMTVLVFRLALHDSGPVFAIVAGAVTFLVPKII